MKINDELHLPVNTDSQIGDKCYKGRYVIELVQIFKVSHWGIWRVIRCSTNAENLIRAKRRLEKKSKKD